MRINNNKGFTIIELLIVIVIIGILVAITAVSYTGITNGANTAEIKRESMRLGIKTMRQSGLTKVKEGVTSLEEVLRVTVSDD